MKSVMTLVLLSVLSLGLLATDIHSTIGGGNWFDGTTWIGGIVPGVNDNVFIHGVVFTLDVTCNNLTLYPGGQLLNHRSQLPNVTVNGNLNNAGSIANNDMNYLGIVVKGNIVNTGTISCQNLYLSGVADQYLNSSLTLNPVNLIDTISSSAVILQSDLSLTNTSVNLNNATLVLNGSTVCDLSLSGGYLLYAVIQGGNGATVTMGGNAYLEFVSANELVLEGVVIIVDGVSIGSLYNNATLYNYITLISTLEVTQRLENHGIIRNNPSMNYLSVNLGGDLYNYGTISNYSFTLNNAVPANLYQSAGCAPISSTLFYSTSASADYQMLSCLRFLNSNIHFYGKGICMYSGAESYGFTVNGGHMQNAVLDGEASSFLSLDNSAYLEYVTADEIIFNGVVIVSDGVNIGNLYNYATLYNYVTMINTLSVAERLENHGTIRNNPTMNLLYLNLGGDLYNYGMMSNNTITFTGLTSRTEFQVHHVYQDADAQPFTCASFTVQADSGNLQLLSDLRFSNSAVNLNGKTIQMSMDRSCYGLKLEGGYLYYAILDTNGFSTLDLSSGAYLDYVTAEDIILRGTIIIVNEVVFDDVVVYGTVYNYINNVYSMVCNGNLVNYGTIRNNPSMNWLYLYCRKNLSNYGIIQNQQTLIDGAEDQYVLNGAGSSIACPAGFNLTSEIGPAQWFFNGVVNNTNYYLTLTVTPSDLGVWQPFDGTSFGRSIILGNGLPVTTPQNIVLFPNGAEFKLQWTEVDYATYYTVYTSPDPYGTFVPLEAKVFDSDQTDGIVWMDILPSETLRFYKVSAGN